MPNSNLIARRKGVYRREILKGGLVGLATPFLMRVASAATTFPDRPIKLIVPFGVGGPVDIVARVMSQPLGEALGGSVFVDNKLGASGNLGAAAVARAEPDGYTILVASSNFIINAFLTSNLPYDPVVDFTPLVELAETPSAFAVRPQLGARTLKEFVEMAAKSNSYSYSHPGFGTVSHMAGEFLKARAGFNMVAVPHNGGGPAMQTLLTGSVEFCSAALPAIQPHIKSGTVIGLGVTSTRRWSELAEIPTVIESGFPDFDLANFTAFLLPAKTPPDIAERLSKASIQILGRPEIQSKLLSLGFEVTARPPDALKARILREMPFWKKLVETAGIKPT
jgi:tripartite-type tricarboxylate transporter receptor subunit TctC